MKRSLIPFIAALVAAAAIGILNPSVPTPNQAAIAQINR